jgi:hypothetical protein
LIDQGSIDGKWLARGSVLFLLLLAASAGAFALDPGRTIAQFYHTAWTVEDGVPGRIEMLAQDILKRSSPGENGFSSCAFATMAAASRGRSWNPDAPATTVSAGCGSAPVKSARTLMFTAARGAERRST